MLQECREKAFKVDVEYHTLEGELRAQPKVSLQQDVPEADYYEDLCERHIVLHQVAKQTDPVADGILSGLQMCTFTCCRQGAKNAIPGGVAKLASLLEDAFR